MGASIPHINIGRDRCRPGLHWKVAVVVDNKSYARINTKFSRRPLFEPNQSFCGRIRVERRHPTGVGPGVTPGYIHIRTKKADSDRPDARSLVTVSIY